MRSFIAGRIEAHHDRGQQLRNIEATMWELWGGEEASPVVARLRGIEEQGIDDIDFGGSRIQDEVEREESEDWYRENGLDDDGGDG